MAVRKCLKFSSYTETALFANFVVILTIIIVTIIISLDELNFKHQMIVVFGRKWSEIRC
jgi:hypothetical protein